jgi:acyl-CoA dehydrogenase
MQDTATLQGLNFELSEEQLAVRDAARDFAQNVLKPEVIERDREQRFPKEEIWQLGELGFLGMMVDPKYGGGGMDTISYVLAMEEISKVDASTSVVMSVNNSLVCWGLEQFGTEEQKQKYLGMLCNGLRDDGRPHMAAYAVTEPGAGSDVQGVKARATKQGDKYVINGQKMWITNGSVCSWYFVLAYTNPEAGYKGLSGFIVDADTPGITVGKKEKNMGQRASDTRGITFDNVEVPAENLLGGKEGTGFFQAMGAFDKSRPIVASAAVGLARAAYDHARAYSLERQTFGVPIAKHQAVSFMIAEMAMNIQAARHLVWESAWLHDNGDRNTKQAAFAKAFAADMAAKVATDAVQVFGGYGFNEEYPVEKLYRDSKIFQIYEGTSQIQRMIIAREIYKEIQ